MSRLLYKLSDYTWKEVENSRNNIVQALIADSEANPGRQYRIVHGRFVYEVYDTTPFLDTHYHWCQLEELKDKFSLLPTMGGI